MSNIKIPHSKEVEQIVLACLFSFQDTMLEGISMLNKDLFYVGKHKILFEIIMDVFNTHNTIDLLLLCEEIKKRNKSDVLPNHYLNKLSTYVSYSYPLKVYIMMLMEYNMRRIALRVSQKIQVMTQDTSQDVFETLSSSVDMLYKASETHLRGDYSSLGNSVVIDEITEKNTDFDNTIYSGYKNLDRITGGWQPGNMIVLAARPSIGKTALALSIMRNVAVEFNKPIAIFSMEMSSNELVKRYLSLQTGIPHETIKNKTFNSIEKEDIKKEYKSLLQKSIFIDCTGSLTALELRARARRMHMKEGLSMIVVDYMQLMRSTSTKSEVNREQQISNISREIKSLAKELQIPILALSQLSRALESRGGDKRPILSDLRESGSIEQDADMVMFLYRPEKHNILQDNNGESTKGIAEVILSKNRNGRTGTAILEFQEEQMRFLDKNDYGVITTSEEVKQQVNHPPF